MASRFSHYPARRRSGDLVFNSYTILCNTHDAASSFLNAFESTRTARRARGTATDEEQDLLRAMLVFASSGLDSMVKQLVGDVLPFIVGQDVGAHSFFMNSVETRLKRALRPDKPDTGLLASILVSSEPKELLVRGLVNDLTSKSLQSREELSRAAAAFDIPTKMLTKNPDLLKTVFDVRNQISHEMDIDFKQPNRNRRPRRKADMIRYTNEILRVANSFLQQVNKKVQTTSE